MLPLSEPRHKDTFWRPALHPFLVALCLTDAKMGTTGWKRMRSMTWLRGLLLACLLLAPAAWASEAREAALGQASELWAQGEYGRAIAVLEPFEAEADPELDAMLASLLVMQAIDGLRPEDVANVDLARAIALAERAAAAGSPMALNELHLIHLNGWGVPVDLDKARDFLERAVAAGDEGARTNYAANLFEGSQLLPRDRDRACEIFNELLDVVDPQPYVAYYLGLARVQGDCGFTADPGQGIELVRLAADQGLRFAEFQMGLAYEEGVGVERDLAQALDWFQRAADQGVAPAQWRIGMSFVRGEGRAVDPARAVAWFSRAADAGHVDGLTSLAVMYATGSGVEKDTARALSLYQQAVDAGGVHAYRNLAGMYLVGEGVEADPVQAWLHYEMGVALGNKEEGWLRDAIEARLEPEARARAEAALAEWKSGQSR